MSVQAMAWVIEHAPVKESELICLLMIANHAHSDGSGSYPSTATLARECRISQRHVITLIHSLEKKHLVFVQRGEGPQGVHLYTVLMRGEIISPLKSAVISEGVGGEVGDMQGVNPTSPKPSYRTVIKKENHNKSPISPFSKGTRRLTRAEKKELEMQKKTDWDKYVEEQQAKHS